MVKEIAWYIEDGRFSALLNEMRAALDAYSAAKCAGLTGDALDVPRETARHLFEEQCVSAGLRDAAASYINLDAEFFNGDRVDDVAFDVFIKELIQAHGYQRVLWMYMGTTASLTVISKTLMADRGLCYEDYLPVAYKAAHPPSKPFAECAGADDEFFYLYPDASISKIYDSHKARLRFDALQDTSGVDWRMGYDPNAMIPQVGWHSAFDRAGFWTRFNDTPDAAVVPDDENRYDIELIRVGDTAILYDPGALLISPEALVYLTDAGEVYGALRIAPTATWEAIRDALHVMGLSAVSMVGSRPDTPQYLESYRSFLKELAIPELRTIDSLTLSAAKTSAWRNVARYAIPLERLFHVLSPADRA
ncbi:MAG: hypothetical protein LBS86_05365, partial [Treponema sp.]|nr:hypothetical protein [Treponema sp.]